MAFLLKFAHEKLAMKIYFDFTQESSLEPGLIVPKTINDGNFDAVVAKCIQIKISTVTQTI